jgi:hypothetical protein
MSFKCKYEPKHSQINLTSDIKDEHEKVCEALYKVSYHNACHSEVKMTAGNLIMPHKEDSFTCA